MAAGALATGAISPGWPWLLIAAAALVYGISAVSWNGVSMGEIVRWSSPGTAASATSATTAVIFSGAVVGPVTFTLILRATDSYATGFTLIAFAALIAGSWQTYEGWRLRSSPLRGEVAPQAPERAGERGGAE